jgi:hypothetical protein
VLVLAVPILFIASAASIAAISLYHFNPPHFDTRHNGLWVGYQWLNGTNIRTGLDVPDDETKQFFALIKRAGIRYVFVRAGPILPNGEIGHRPGSFFSMLQQRSPDTVYLPWLPGNAEQLDLSNPTWRKSFIDQLQKLRDQGIAGIHLNIEPVSDNDSAYLDLLRDIRAAFGPSFFLSLATPPAGPFGLSFGEMKNHVWSKDYYKRIMRHANQSVVMAYNTRLNNEMPYIAFVAHQTGLLLSWSCQVPGHRVLVGIPAYEHAPDYSNPRIENIRTAALGVRTALHRTPEDSVCFEGVSVYANWTTSADEWSDYQTYWAREENTMSKHAKQDGGST